MHAFGGIENIVPKIKWHLSPFKKGDSGAVSGFKCPLMWPWPPTEDLGRPGAPRVGACDIEETPGKGKLMVDYRLLGKSSWSPTQSLYSLPASWG